MESNGSFRAQPWTGGGNSNKRKNDAFIIKHVDGKKGKHTEEESIVKVGDVLNISDLLFTQTRHYLIKYKDNQLVNDKQLAGKVIVLHFVSLVNGNNFGNNFWKRCTRDLLDVYDKLEPKGGFEVVFVAVGDDVPCFDIGGGSTSTCSTTPHERFQERFSTMPWTAIPFSDLKSRKHLERIFGIFGNRWVDVNPFSFVIDPRGVLVQFDIHLFSRYGAAGFPFTNERFKTLDSEDEVAREQLSMESLLASPERDYVITNKGEQVPISKLKDKVVGFFFFANAWNECITWKLKLAYEELSKNMDDFEVVLINLLPISSDISEDALWKNWKSFEVMPWLAIPFNDTCSSRKLLRIFQRTICDPGPDPASKLVIIGPHGKFIEPFGAHILMCYGISAYPFTRFSAVKSIMENLKDVKPEMLWNVDAVFTKQNGSKVRFSQIAGKRILVLFQNYRCCISKHTLKKLKALYIQMKGTNDEFEVIHIHEGGEFNRVASGFPWLMLPRFDSTSYAWQFMIRFFYGDYYGLVAFDRDGTVVRMTPRPAIGDIFFPFYEFDCMEDEILLFVEDVFNEPLNTLTHFW